MSLDDSCEQKVGQSTHFVQRYDNSKCDNSDVTQSTTIAARSAVLRRSFRKDFPAAVSRGRRLPMGRRRTTSISIWPDPLPSTSSVTACPEISRRHGRAGRKARIRPHQPVHHAGRRRVRAGAARVRRGTLSRRRRLLHLRRIGIDRDRAETGAPVSGRNRTSHAVTRSSAASRAITDPRWARCRSQATSAAAKSICPWCASSRTSECPTATVATSTAPTAAATAASNTPPNSSVPSKPAKGEAAAFIFEPVSGATLGAVVPPPGYLQSIAEICRRHGVLLIADEVMTGMGRTGRNFAVEHCERCARHSRHRQRALQRIRAARRRHRQQESGRRDRRPAPARSCTASPITRIQFHWPPDAQSCATCSRRI